MLSTVIGLAIWIVLGSLSVALLSLSTLSISKANVYWIEARRAEGKPPKAHPFAEARRPVVLERVDLDASRDLEESLGVGVDAFGVPFE